MILIDELASLIIVRTVTSLLLNDQPCSCPGFESLDTESRTSKIVLNVY